MQRRWRYEAELAQKRGVSFESRVSVFLHRKKWRHSFKDDFLDKKNRSFESDIKEAVLSN